MDFRRRIAGKSKLERVTNNRTREIIKVTHTVVDEVKVQQLNWYGHLLRMADDRR